MIEKAGRATGYGLQTVWSTFTPLAVACNAVNLGQGFPDISPADFVISSAAQALCTDLCNQYAPSRGRPSLIQELMADYSQDLGRVLTPSNVLVTLGANQGTFVTLQTFIEHGQCVLLIEPYFDIYKPSVQIVGGRVCTVQLIYTEGAWILDMALLEDAIKRHNVKTIIINTPQNPTGKIFNLQELQDIARLAIAYDLLVISDEVYDELYFTATRPTRLASIPGMWDRTITVGSAGKRFGVTGWRVGWLIGHENLIDPILAVHSRTEACANSLKIARQRNYFEEVRTEYKQKRDYLSKVLEASGMPCSLPDGGYFIMANTSNLKVPASPDQTEWAEFPGKMEPEDYAKARWFTRHIGVATIPPSAFYEHESLHLAKDWLRFCFCKRQDTLDSAAERIRSNLHAL